MGRKIFRFAARWCRIGGEKASLDWSAKGGVATPRQPFETALAGCSSIAAQAGWRPSWKPSKVTASLTGCWAHMEPE